MGEYQMLSYHPTATTTYKIREEIKNNPENLTLEGQAKKYNVSIPTINLLRNNLTYLFSYFKPTSSPFQS